MPNRPRIFKDFVVVPALERLVAKEVHRGVCDPARLLGLVLQVLQAVRLVPAGGEHVKRDLPANGEGQAQMPKALAQLRDKRLADLVHLIVRLVVVALLDARVAADGRDVDHAVAELDKGAALDGDVEVSDVVQAEVDELLVLRLADPLDEAVGRERLAVLVRCQAVLREAEVEERLDVHVGRAKLFLLLDQVAATHEADGGLLAETGEKLEHLGGDGLFLGGWVGQASCVSPLSFSFLHFGFVPFLTGCSATRGERKVWVLRLPAEQESKCHRHRTNRWCSSGGDLREEGSRATF